MGIDRFTLAVNDDPAIRRQRHRRPPNVLQMHPPAELTLAPRRGERLGRVRWANRAARPGLRAEREDDVLSVAVESGLAGASVMRGKWRLGGAGSIRREHRPG